LCAEYLLNFLNKNKNGSRGTTIFICGSYCVLLGTAASVLASSFKTATKYKPI